MSKSVYSLVLADDVVQAVDKAAYSRGTSRSNFINQVLAEALSCVTPEKRMREIFERMEQLMSPLEELQLLAQPSDSMLSFRSALRYKYKPTIRYSVELYRHADGTVGELKVSFRTQSSQLLECLRGFAQLWVALENRTIGHHFPKGQILYTLEEGRLIRQFLLPREQHQQTTEEIAGAISGYIQLLDRAIKCYFAGLEQPQQAAAEIEALYAAYLQRGAPII